MRIEGNDPLYSTKTDAGKVRHKKKESSDKPAAAEDKVSIQSTGKRSLDPGNMPSPLKGARGSAHPALDSGDMQLDPLVLEPVYNQDGNPSYVGSFVTSGNSIVQFSTVDLSSTDESLAKEVLDTIAANHRKWETKTFIYDAREGPEIKNIKLVGSFNPATGQYDSTWNKGIGIAMHDDGVNGDEKAGDGLYTAQVMLDADDPHEFKWGAIGDVFDEKGKLVSAKRWLVMTEEPPTFTMNNGSTQEVYAPLSNHLMGVHKNGEDGITFRTWSPEVGKGDLKDYRLCTDLFDDQTGQIKKSLPMTRDERTGNWSLELPTGWKELEGSSYQYSVRNSRGELLIQKPSGPNKKAEPVAYSDPYSRFLQGQQRGLERLFVDPVLGVETGWYDGSGGGGPNYTINPLWARFTVNSHPEAESVKLVLNDEKGHQLTRSELLQRLGEPKLKPYDQASAEEKKNVDILKNWKIDVSGKVTNYKWTDSVSEDGSISMRKVGGDGIGVSWVSVVNNFPALVGLKYEFQVTEKGKLVGDINADGVLQEGERKITPFNDPYSNVISARPGSERCSLIKESSFQYKYDDAPRKETDFRKYVIYEAHVGSFMTTKDSAHPSTFQDMMNNLDYVEKIGANTIELLPFNEFGGRRDWGYTPDFYFAGAETYGFELPRAKALELGVIRPDQDKDKQSVWVSGTDAVKVFVDEAHRRGFNVMSDVVYNHTSGKADADNPLWQIDGDKQSFFKWWGQYRSETPWGAKPNFSSQEVKNFYANNASQQVEEFHLDGIRFDFTQVLHDTGSVAEKREGMNTLRQINRSLQFLRPNVLTYTAAEDFTHNWLVAADLDKSEWQGQGEGAIEKKGMGFSAVWNDSFHHDLLGLIDGGNPEKNADRFMDSLLNHKGVTSWDRAVVFSHNHDEVGNSGSWVGRAAAHSRDDADVMKPYPRSAARSAAAITLTSAGVPMIFQGEEFMANNDFKHGMTATWGADMSWTRFNVTPDKLANFKRIALLPPDQKKKEAQSLPSEERAFFERFDSMSPEQKSKAEDFSLRAGQFECYKDLIALRGSSSAFMADTQISRVFTHNLDRVLAYERKSGNEDFIVITNIADQERPGYKIDLPPGNWKEVFNTNASEYGGSGSGNGGAIIDRSQGVLLPSGATIILKKV
jgi:maltooligosyltrehalose trehalohydrolase